MNIGFKIHLKVYKWKISTIIINLQMCQGSNRPFIIYTSQEILMSLPRFIGSEEKNSALTVAHSQIWFDTLNKVYFWLPLFCQIIFQIVNFHHCYIIHFIQYSLVHQTVLNEQKYQADYLCKLFSICKIPNNLPKSMFVFVADYFSRS